MFEEYLKDSSEFFKIASYARKEKDEISARRYYRVTIMCLFSSIEAFVNYNAQSYAEAMNIELLIINFLNDKEQYFSPTNGIKDRKKYNSIDDKLKTLIYMFNPNYDFCNSKEWSHFISLKEFRDSIIHSKQIEDETPLLEYNKLIKKGFNATVQLMDLISNGLFKRPLRKQITDLVPE